MKYKLLFSKEKRPFGSRDRLKDELIDYIKESTKNGHYPSRREIEKTFHLRFSKLFLNINSLYKKAGSEYKLAPNQHLKEMKSDLLLKLILKNLKKFKLDLITYRNSKERGIDIVAKMGNKRIGIELKAYNKYEKLKNRDVKQVERFINKENLNKAIIITTTNKKDNNLKDKENITIIDYENLIRKLNLKRNKSIDFIRKYSVNRENTKKELKRKKILDYVYKKYKEENIKPSYNKILRDLHLDLYTYFRSLSKIYKTLKIPPPLGNMGARRAKNPNIDNINIWKEEFKKFIIEEIKKGNKYPSGVEIGKKFVISHIWNIIEVSKLYRELNLYPYRERKNRPTSVSTYES